MDAEKEIPYLIVFNKYDLWKDEVTAPAVSCDIAVSAVTGFHIVRLRELLTTKLSVKDNTRTLVRDLLQPADVVVLVVPLDSSAPKGRLILPQQQVIRDVLEAGASALVCRDTELPNTLKRLRDKPRLVITDSQAFSTVANIVPQDVPLTSFSILFSRYKGNLAIQLSESTLSASSKTGIVFSLRRAALTTAAVKISVQLKFRAGCTNLQKRNFALKLAAATSFHQTSPLTGLSYTVAAVR